MAIEPTNEAGSEIADSASGLARIVEEYWTPVYRLLVWMTGNTHDAEELTQETFLRAFRQLNDCRAGTRVRPWLMRIATNLCLDLKRKQKRAKRVPLQDELSSSETSPDYRLETVEQAVLLKTALEELSETTRTVFHLRVQEAIPFREIAEMLSTTEQAARWHMHQARSKLLARMKETIG